MRVLLLVVCVLILNSFTVANEFSVRLSEESVSVILDPEATEKNSAQFAFVHNDDENSHLLSAGLFANGSREGFNGRLGGKVYYADLDDDSGYGVALGGEISMPVAEGFTVNGGLYYGPDSLSFGDVDGYQEWFVRINYQVFDNARVGAGVGSWELEPDSGNDVEVDDGFFIEMNLGF